MSDSRSLRRKKKRRKRKMILAIVLIFALLGVGYTGYEYMAGKKQAMGEANTNGNSEKYKEEFQGVDNNDGKTTVLLLGTDQRGDETARTDTIMIAQYDPEKNTAKLASLMRDTYVKIPGFGYNKLNAAFALGGPELMRRTIEENFGIETEYYSIVDFNGFTQIVDTLSPDGIEIDVEKDMYYKDDAGTINLQEGTNKLNGEELLGYARFRKDQESDFGRVRRQQQVMQRLKEEAVSASGFLKIPRLIGTIQPFVDTNMGSGKVLGIGKDFILNAPDEIETLTIPKDVTYWNESYPGIGAVLSHNEQETREALKSFFETAQSDTE